MIARVTPRCATKRPDRLQDLLDLYVVAHNARILDLKTADYGAVRPT